MYRTWLIPYLEGTLDAEQRRQVEARLAEDPDLAAEMESLRRAEPRLRRAVAHLRQTEETAPVPAPLWPRLRERLDPRPQRPARGPAFWWLGGTCAASAVVLLALMLTPKTQTPLRDKKLARELKHAPHVVFHRNNATGTVVAAKLRTRTVRVAMARRAVNPHVAAVLARRKLLPATPPPAPPLPNLRLAGKLPMPVAPPFQMAKREDEDQSGASDAAPAPKHSPLPEGMKAKNAERSYAGGVVSLPYFKVGVPPAPTYSQPPLTGSTHGVVNGSDALAPVPPPLEKNAASGEGPTQNALAAAAPMEARARAPQVQALDGAVGLDSATDALPLRQRLERTVTPPLYGTPAGAQELRRLLLSAQQEGTLDALTGQMEQGPVDASQAAAQEAVNGRLLAAIYELAGDPDRALAERRRVALLGTAEGEDWFELAQTEARLGNTASAQRAYAQALHAAGAALSPAHRAIAHQNLP